MDNKKTKIVQAELIEFLCSECEGGVLRVSDSHAESKSESDTGVKISCSPTMWPHLCHKCHKAVEIAGSYPKLLYGGETWVLEKSVNSKIDAFRNQVRRLFEG